MLGWLPNLGFAGSITVGMAPIFVPSLLTIHSKYEVALSDEEKYPSSKEKYPSSITVKEKETS